jgi:hypothetical protein
MTEPSRAKGRILEKVCFADLCGTYLKGKQERSERERIGIRTTIVLIKTGKQIKRTKF